MPNEKAIVIVFRTDGLGDTQAQDLKYNLSTSFLSLIADADPLPRAMCFYTDGVKLACQGSPVLDLLRSLESRGVRLILCTTCLNYFGLADKVQVGIPGGMGDIVEAMWSADSVLTV
jgi:sulfur relay (sulfurtransferase) complex TusBCD TusD component (DsrE family)